MTGKGETRAGRTKDVVSAVKRAVTPGQHLTKKPSPRVLIHRFGAKFGVVDGQHTVVSSRADDLAERLRASGVPTVEVVWSSDTYNLKEWDCLITTEPPLREEQSFERPDSGYGEPQQVHSWRQAYPSDLSVFCLVAPGGDEVLDAYPSHAPMGKQMPLVAVAQRSGVAGTQLRKAEGLRDSLAALVLRDLVPVAKDRRVHLSFVRHEQPDSGELDSKLPLTAFLYGPNDVVLAGSYPRNEASSVWLIPDDVPDEHPWVIEALREWHDLYPDRFPALPDWNTNSEWLTAAEAAIAEEKAQHFNDFKARCDQFVVEQGALDDQAAEAKEAADSYQRALLTADGPDLERAVEQAIRDLGFRVTNMDEVHAEGDRREDLRVYDDSDAEWVAIVEIKGGKRGAQENELHGMGKWATRFALDERREPSAQWFVVNHLRLTDPSARPVPFGNKPAVAATFSEVNGTIVDTRALFDLLRIVEAEPTLAAAAREFLKAKPSVVTRVRPEDLQAVTEESGES